MASNRLGRYLNALPDTVTALFFLVVWFLPFQFGESSVRNGMLTMLVEFVVVHASGFLGGLLFESGASRRDQLKYILGFGLLYSIFIAAWAWMFEQWWPFLVFGWLLVGKFTTVLDSSLPSGVRRQRMQSEWATGVMAYLFAIFATVLLPVPQFGITADLIESLHLPGSGLWVDQPQRVIAAGAIYFGVLAWSKFKNHTVASSILAKSSPRKRLG